MAESRMAGRAVDPASEDALYAREVAEVKKWWASPRWRHTKRAYTAEDIVAKRGHMRIEYPSNQQSAKLWDILERRFNVSWWGGVADKMGLEADALSRGNTC
jgi:isocitrate lyase